MAIHTTSTNRVNDSHDNDTAGVDAKVDCLIVGTGPAGGALAAFLATYGKNEIGETHLC